LSKIEHSLARKVEEKSERFRGIAVCPAVAVLEPKYINNISTVVLFGDLGWGTLLVALLTSPAFAHEIKLDDGVKKVNVFFFEGTAD
jgi:hypothetical protein